MSSPNRLQSRVLNVYDAKDRTTLIGGLSFCRGMVHRNLYQMLRIILVIDCPWTLTYGDSNVHIGEDEQPLERGLYYLAAEGPFSLTEEEYMLRSCTLTESKSKPDAFQKSILRRDLRCVLTGRPMGRNPLNGSLNVGMWEAVHIVPRAYRDYWERNNFSRHITAPPIKGHAMDSAQNGISLIRAISVLFANYEVGINPDDDFKVVSFQPTMTPLLGRLQQDIIEHPQGPSAELLRWHFRQCVLANVKGVGAPSFARTYPPGSDMINEIISGPEPAKRLEFEFFNRLVGFERR